jgi:2-keto-3-deoxy-L-rhamnonate aldolase RhmA
MGYLHDLGNPAVRKVTEAAIKQIVAAGRTCGTSPLNGEDLQLHHQWGARFFYTQPLTFVQQASSEFFGLVDSSSRGVRPAEASTAAKL